MSATATPFVAHTIQAILDARPEPTERFIPTRYPFTYGYDFFRGHATDFGFDADDERRGTRSSAMIREYADRTGQDPVEVTLACADAYLAYYNIPASPEAKEAALAYQRQVSWRSLGLDAPVHRAHDAFCDKRTPCSEHAQ